MAISVENNNTVSGMTNKILLRPFRPEDALEKENLDTDPDIKRYLGATPPKLEDEIADFERQGFGLVAIVDASTDHIVGFAKLQYPDWNVDLDLGLELIVAVAPKAWGRGFALEAAQMLIKIGCGSLQQKQIVGRVAASNIASLSLVCGLGMTKVGERDDIFDGRQHIYVASCEDRAG